MLQSIFGIFPWPRKQRNNNGRSWENLKSFQVSCTSLSSSDSEEDFRPVIRKKSKKLLRRETAPLRIRKEKQEVEPEVKLVCYLCGQQVERSSLGNHVEGCLAAWNRREELKSADERVSVPVKPKQLDQPLPQNADDVSAFNKAMRSIWLKATNLRCKHCKKTFKAGAYHKHVKTCNASITEPKVEESVECSTNKVAQKVKKVTRRTFSFTEKSSPYPTSTTEKLESRQSVKSTKSSDKSESLVKKIPSGLKKLCSKRATKADTQPSDSAREIPIEVDARRVRSKSFSVHRSKVFITKESQLQTDSSRAPSDRTAPSKESSRRKELATLEKSLEKIKARQQKRAKEKKSKSARHSDPSEKSYAQETVSSTMRKERQREDQRLRSENAEASENRCCARSASFPSKGPRGYTCYLCGRQFGSASLAIHVRQCRQLWEDREALKRRKRERRPLPTPPPEMSAPLPTDYAEIQTFNDSMCAFWEARALHHCPYCARTFTTEAFEKHQRVCTAETPGGPNGLSKHRQVQSEVQHLLKHSSSTDSAYSDSAPIGYYCYLCGRQYGSRSLFLHIPRCQKLWEDREATKPKKSDRRPLPPPPPQLEGFPNITLPTDREEVLEFNNAVYSYWDKVSLYTCSKCGRSFNEESFEKHQRLCIGNRPLTTTRSTDLDKQPSRNDRNDEVEATGNYDNQPCHATPIHYVCYLCGRKYGSKSLMIHIPQCEKRWLADEANKPKGQSRSLPPRPAEFQTETLPSKTEEIDQFNTLMLQHWEKYSLMQCKTCGRTFRPEALEKHVKHCAASHS